MFEVSIVIPVYNAQDYITKAVESALSQPETKEVILVEDGSTDDSLFVCKYLASKDDRIKLFQHPDIKNHGRSQSRNLGISKASSEYIAFLDADDYYLPNRFLADKVILTNNPNIDGVYNSLGRHYYSESKALLHQKLNLDKPTTVSAVVPPEELILVLTKMKSDVHGYFSGDALTVRKSIFSKCGLFDTAFNISEDTLLWHKMALTANLAAGSIDTPVAVRGIHDSNTTLEQINNSRSVLYKHLWTWSKNSRVNPIILAQYYSEYIISETNIRPNVSTLFQYIFGYFRYPHLFLDKRYFGNISKFFKNSKTIKRLIKYKSDLQNRFEILSKFDKVRLGLIKVDRFT